MAISFMRFFLNSFNSMNKSSIFPFIWQIYIISLKLLKKQRIKWLRPFESCCKDAVWMPMSLIETQKCQNLYGKEIFMYICSLCKSSASSGCRSSCSTVTPMLGNKQEIKQ